jgi:hypothetical protein
MRNKIVTSLFVLAIVFSSLWLGNDVVVSAHVYLAIIVGIIPALACIWIILRHRTVDERFLLRLFLAALAVRYILAFIIYSRHLQQFLGADAETYDFFGNALLQSWEGLVDPNAFWLVRYTSTSTSGFGMFYFVAGIYYAIGQNPLAIQLINCAFGAGACITGYKIVMILYPNQRVARAVAVMTAFSPSLVLWTSQALKDGPIALCLCLCVLYTLKLRARFQIKNFVLLLIFFCCLYTLRHYAAYIMFAAIGGSLLFTTREKLSPIRILQGAVFVIILGVALSYFGAGEVARSTLDLQHLQRARVWGAKVANTGFGGDVDITDPEAAISYLPIGVLYVLLAPFPWMVNNLRQLITLPELIAWWCLMPMMLKGYWFAIRHRLRQSFVICTFVLGLILSFAMYQSNAGTAYRHRSQLYVFFFVFICIGLELRRSARLEKRARRYQPDPPGRISGAPVRLTGSPVKVQTQ